MNFTLRDQLLDDIAAIRLCGSGGSCPRHLRPRDVAALLRESCPKLSSNPKATTYLTEVAEAVLLRLAKHLAAADLDRDQENGLRQAVYDFFSGCEVR